MIDTLVIRCHFTRLSHRDVGGREARKKGGRRSTREGEGEEATMVLWQWRREGSDNDEEVGAASYGRRRSVVPLKTWKAAMVNLSEMGPNLDSMQKLLAKKAVFVDEETFAKGSLISEQARTIKVLEHGREFLWGALAGGFGEGMMHPIDTLKTRMQSQAVISGTNV
ncbi:hypothetical protein B296_00046012 [Ensete ventricosum]|uniref:Uncharacterized protein n=1 Tax=Ensete ventricosum TaxID=4639 RepID=A0A426YDK9_ENSVE|nr:hypothetical protein B296_00046012 [Ensete ventricosum]